MAGTILKQLSTTAQADSTAISAANSGFSSWPAPGTGAAGVHLAAAAMGEPVGYRMTQTSTGQVFGYLDLTSAVPVFAFRMMFRYSATPSAEVTILRGYPDAHLTTMWSIAITTSNRVHFVEPTGLNATSPSGTPLTPGSDYVMLGLIDTAAMDLTIEVYPRTSGAAVFTMAETLLTSTPVLTTRAGIGTNSALAQLDINSAFAIGSGDLLARTDFTPANTAPSAGPNQDVDAYTLVTLVGSDLESGVTWSQTAGSPTVTLGGSGATRTFTAPALRAGTTLTFTATDGVLTDAMTVEVFPHNEWAVVGGVEVPMQILQARAVVDPPADPAPFGTAPFGTAPFGG